MAQLKQRLHDMETRLGAWMCRDEDFADNQANPPEFESKARICASWRMFSVDFTNSKRAYAIMMTSPIRMEWIGIYFKKTCARPQRKIDLSMVSVP